jgi:hypothetical protein
METLVGSHILPRDWESGGDYWNGAFHLRDFNHTTGFIHHHYKPGDVERRGWSGLVYLSPDAPETSGTTIWRQRQSGRCVASFGPTFSRNTADYELAFLVENKYNRLLLFRENVLHRGEAGFGSGTQARLTQTFFFCIR